MGSRSSLPAKTAYSCQRLLAVWSGKVQAGSGYRVKLDQAMSPGALSPGALSLSTCLPADVRALCATLAEMCLGTETPHLSRLLPSPGGFL